MTTQAQPIAVAETALDQLRNILRDKLTEFDQRITAAVLELEDESLEVAETLDKITVTDQIEYDELGERLKVAVEFTDRAEAFFNPWRELFYKPYQAVLDRKRQVLATVEGSLKAAKNRMLTFEREERQRAETAARIAQDQQRKDEEERRLALATEVEKAGLAQPVVDAILEAPSTAPTITSRPISRPAGLSSRQNWQAEVYDLDKLFEAAARDRSLRVYFLINQPSLNKAASISKTELAIPGVRAVDKGSLAVRR